MPPSFQVVTHGQMQKQPSTRTNGTPRRARRLRRSCFISFMALALIAGFLAALAFTLIKIPSPTNILIVGIDRRPDEGNAVRTDSLLLVHADPSGPHLVMLSIPRDLWVSIPGWGESRINSAHVYAEMETPGSGPARAAQTVSENFGVPVHGSLRLDFEAFRDVVDAAGGIDVEVPKPVVDNAYPTENYGTMRIEIPAGWQHMDGETALQYARSRHGSNDFDRAARQQQIVLALAKKLAKPNGWLMVPRVYRAFHSAVDTDLSLRDVVRLILTWKLADDGAMETIVIDGTMTTPFRTAQGAAVLLPRWDLIQPLVRATFAP
jgi:LCP family protein required for cell wall assembly